MASKNISEMERRVMAAWADVDEDAPILTFAGIASRSGIDKPRRYVRSLARKGLLYHERIWDGERSCPAGSGYCPTQAGLIYLKGTKNADLGR